jgi:hypothetical protein
VPGGRLACSTAAHQWRVQLAVTAAVLTVAVWQ